MIPKTVLWVIFCFLVSCSSQVKKDQLSQKELVEYYTRLMEQTRPLLNSDELPYMECEKRGQASVEKAESENSEIWQSLGDLDLREKAIAQKANIMSMTHKKFGKIHKYTADLYSCKKISKVRIVDIAGMCKASEERVFKIKYNPEALRKLGEIILKTKMEYYALAKHYRSFHFRDIRYSFTKKEYTGKAYFFKCY